MHQQLFVKIKLYGKLSLVVTVKLSFSLVLQYHQQLLNTTEHFQQLLQDPRERTVSV